MSIRPRQVIGAVIVLIVASSVATSQTPDRSDLHQNYPSGVQDSSNDLGSADARNLGFGLGRGQPGDVAGLPSAATWPPAKSGVEAGAAGDMIAFANADGAGSQTITLVNTRKSWMAVYHIDRSGKVRLVSSRPIEADFSLQLNVTSPTPEEIRRIGKR